MSAFYADYDSGSSDSFDLDQVELDFLYDFEPITAQVDLDYQRGDANEIDLEQAFITYDFGNDWTMSAGKFLSYHGWETAEPTGLYQYSYAYSFPSIPGYHNGVTLDTSGDWGSFGFAIVDTVFGDDGSLGNGGDDYDYGFEAKLAFTPVSVEGLTLYFGYALDSGDTGVDDASLINFWSSYEMGDHLFALEYNIFEVDDLDIDQWLLMWNVAVSDPGSLTLRISHEDLGATEFDKYTAAYLHTVTDNLAIVTEISQVDSGFDDGIEAAVEALFTF